MPVVDASVWLAAMDSADPAHPSARSFIASVQPLVALDLTLHEVASVTSRWPDRQVGAAVLELVLEAAAELVRVDGSRAAAARDLAASSKLSAYDAAYVCAARERSTILVSLDQRDLVRPGFALTPAQALAEL